MKLSAEQRARLLRSAQLYVGALESSRQSIVDGAEASLVEFVESLLSAPPAGTAQEQAERYAGAPNAVIGLSSRRVAIDAWLAGHQAALTATAAPPSQSDKFFADRELLHESDRAPPSREAQLQACVDERADFEKWCRKTWVAGDEAYVRSSDKRRGSAYELDHIEFAWNAWQAARRLRSAEGTKG